MIVMHNLSAKGTIFRENMNASFANCKSASDVNIGLLPLDVSLTPWRVLAMTFTKNLLIEEARSRGNECCFSMHGRIESRRKTVMLGSARLPVAAPTAVIK
jgi:hypothetical protein